MTFSVEGRDVVVVGGGRSGRAAAKLLASRGARVTVTDDAPLSEEAAEALAGYGVATRIGPDSHAVAAGADLVVLSPGVPPQQPAFDAARAGGVPVIGEIELASRWLSGRVIAITGTKGK
jgi:UDP-N-acetylmuramoylalanine--D-glutamate ligase